MKTSNGFNKLGRVKTSSSLRKLRFFPQVEEKFTTIQEIHNEIELCISLESIM
jgi:hypothetical protein